MSDSDLMKKLVQGLSGWLAFQQAKKSSPLYSEVFVYQPIYELATSLGWKVIPQCKIEKSSSEKTRGKPGKYRTFDFCFFKTEEKRSVALEVKFSRHHGKHNLEIREDIKKFNSISKVKVKGDTYPLKESCKYILLVSGGSGLPKGLGKESDDSGLSKQVRELTKFANDLEGKPKKGEKLYCNPYGWSQKTAGTKSSSFFVMILKRQPGWRKLGKLEGY
jgi:hypothetical protein